VLVTPNAHEAEWLTGQPVRSLHDARRAACTLLEMGVGAVLIKGGHLEEEEAIDVFADRDGVRELRSVRVTNAFAHGLGCTLSAAITARLARGEAVLDACCSAKHWVSTALENAPAIGKGRRPVDHFAPLSRVFSEKDHAR
jgi:hydroxymethylpyrimidine/phosphomethylpyrimidine kinase